MMRGTAVPKFTGADGNGNSVIDGADYTVWRENFGETGPVTAAGQSLPAQNAADRRVASSSSVSNDLIAISSSDNVAEVAAIRFNSSEFSSRQRLSRMAASTPAGLTNVGNQLLLSLVARQRPIGPVGPNYLAPNVESETAKEAETISDAVFDDWTIALAVE
jgi:hypothetical protein